VLRRFKGYEDFDERTEVLWMNQPGTGCQDAPRAFSIKLAWATNDKFGAKPLTHCEQTIVRHDKSHILDFIAAKHVDDIKSAADTKIIHGLIICLKEVFGKGELDITWQNFTCCGVRHSLRSDGAWVMDQHECVKALKPIVSSELTGRSNQSECTPYLSKLFLSLLMATAFALLTRIDVAAYLNGLQRFAQKPLVVHVRRLNAVVRFMQTHLIALV